MGSSCHCWQAPENGPNRLRGLGRLRQGQGERIQGVAKGFEWQGGRRGLCTLCDGLMSSPPAGRSPFQRKDARMIGGCGREASNGMLSLQGGAGLNGLARELGLIHAP